MKTLRFVRFSSIFWFMLLGSGCLDITVDLNVTIGDDKTSVLPTPKPPSGGAPAPTGEGPALDEAQQSRQDEVNHYIASVIYQGATITHAFQLPSGDVVDFMDRNTLAALPYGLPALPPLDTTLPAGVEFGLNELEQIPELLALAATDTPFHRPTFWPYILGADATSIEDYLARFQLGGQPSSSEQLYAGILSQQPNRGVTGFMNQFRPDVEPKSFSLMEFAVACPASGPAQEAIGVVISVDKLNPFAENGQIAENGQPLMDGEPRLHIEYARLDSNGQVQYHWDEFDGSFRPNPFRQRYQPGQKVPFSVLGGTQVEHLIRIFQSPWDGDWWIEVNAELLGYYPGKLFKLLSTGACRTDWYTEVARWQPTSATAWPKTEVGNGQYAKEGIFNTAYMRNPKYYDTLWFEVEPTVVTLKEPRRDLCYTLADVIWGAHRLLLAGGLGGKNPGCTGP